MYTSYTFDKKTIHYCAEIVTFFHKVMCFYFKVKANKYVSLYIETSGVWITSTSGGTYACAVLT